MTEVTMYDSVNWRAIPQDAGYIAIYADGKYAADRDEVQAAYPDAEIISITVTGTDYGAGACDVESGDMSPDQVPNYVVRRLEAHPNGAMCRPYMNRTTWPAVQRYVGNLSAAQRASVRYWVADWTGEPHLLPGADAVQYRNLPDYDVSIVNLDRFFPAP